MFLYYAKRTGASVHSLERLNLGREHENLVCCRTVQEPQDVELLKIFSKDITLMRNYRERKRKKGLQTQKVGEVAVIEIGRSCRWKEAN